jgi:plasmid stability protein
MEKVTLRLPPETKASLRAEAAERGVSLGEHIRDIIDSYRSREGPPVRPIYEISYAHSVADSVESQENGSSEEIGSFTYGSKSILSQ